MALPSRSELISVLLETQGQELDRKSLDELDDRQLLRLYIATGRLRLNPTRSTNFAEDGISHAEVEARVQLFVKQLSRYDLEKFSVETVMSHFLSDALLEAQKDLTYGYQQLPNAVMVAWGKDRENQQERKRNIGKSGGEKAAEKVAAVRKRAIDLALERRPLAGWASAPAAADAIYVDVREFARSLGRNFSRRAIEGWMRDAGIKRGS